MRKLYCLGTLVICASPAAAGEWVASTHCPTCELQTPIPDDWTRNELDSWRTGSGDLGGFKGVLPGDYVTVCNQTFCAKYSYNMDGSWSNGATIRLEKPGDGKGCIPSSPPRRGGGGAGGGAGDPGGTVTVGPLLPRNPVRSTPDLKPSRRCK
jgi:hypothetical protein